jgi:hypothetical protein
VTAAGRELAASYNVFQARDVALQERSFGFSALANDGSMYFKDSLQNSPGLTAQRMTSAGVLENLGADTATRGINGVTTSSSVIYYNITSDGTVVERELVKRDGTRLALPTGLTAYSFSPDDRMAYAVAVTGGWQVQVWENGRSQPLGPAMANNPLTGGMRGNSCGDWAFITNNAANTAKQLMLLKRDGTLITSPITNLAIADTTQVLNHFTDSGQVTISTILGFTATGPDSTVWNTVNNAVRSADFNLTGLGTHGRAPSVSPRWGIASALLDSPIHLAVTSAQREDNRCKVSDGTRTVDLMELVNRSSATRWKSCLLQAINDRGQMVVATNSASLTDPYLVPTTERIGLFLVTPK